MSRLALALALGVWAALPQQSGAKLMFYNPGGVGAQTPATYLGDPARRLREVLYLTPLRHCGIHYWFEDLGGKARTEAGARAAGGDHGLLIRASCNGFLTVFDTGPAGTELTPRTDTRYSGHRLGDEIFRVPGLFEFTRDAPKQLVLVWARSQTEVARSAADAPDRVRDMAKWMEIVHETDDLTPGEVGNYLVNRSDGGVATQIVFRR